MRIIATLLLIILSGAASAQSSPGWVNGQVITQQQLNGEFARKQDYPNGGGGACPFDPCPSQAISVENNSVLRTDGSGHIIFSTTLPTGMIITSPAFAGFATSGTLAGSFSVLTSGTIQTTNVAASASPASGAITSAGGLGVAGAIYAGGPIGMPATVITVTGNVPCTAGATVIKPVTPAPVTCQLPTVPNDGETHLVSYRISGNAYPVTVAAAAPILTSAGSSNSFVMTNLGEEAAFRYVSNQGAWILE